MRNKIKILLTIIFIFFLLNPLIPGNTDETSYNPKYRPIHIQFTAKGCFEKKTMDTILAGIPVTYFIKIKVYQPRTLWFDSELSALKLVRKLQYDNLKNEYRVTLNGRQNITTIHSDFSEVKKIIEEVNETLLLSSSLFKKNDLYYLKYHVEITAESPSELPLPLEYLLSLLPWGKTKTGWSTIPIK